MQFTRFLAARPLRRLRRARPARRIAVVSTPRSGNTWLRHLLGSALGLPERAEHRLDGLDWPGFPAASLLQVHCRPGSPDAAILRREGFRPVTIARHPLDILVSILHFAPHEPQTAQWLGGEGGTEATIHRASPACPAFLDYATGPRAAALLDVSAAWWSRPGVVRVRYEDLVTDPRGELARLVAELGLADSADVAGAVAANTLDRLRPTATNEHFWQGRPGLWRSLIVAADAARIAAAHPAVFRTLGVRADADPTLDRDRSEANWRALLVATRRAAG